LKGILDSTELFYLYGDNQPLARFVDLDYRGCKDTRRLTSGIIHKLGEVARDWRSKRQPNVALLTTEVEYRVICEATRDIVYLKRYLIEQRIIEGNLMSLLCDNQSSIKLVHNLILHKKTKHIKIYYDFVHEKSAKGQIEVS